jgi:integrase
MDTACKQARVDPVRFHELRHTYASGLINRGVPLVFVAAQLGHSDTRMVEKHYGHLAPTALVDAIRTLAPKLGISESTSV